MPGQPRRLTRGVLDVLHADGRGAPPDSRAAFVAACDAVWDAFASIPACAPAAQRMLEHMRDTPIQVGIRPHAACGTACAPDVATVADAALNVVTGASRRAGVRAPRPHRLERVLH